MKKLVKGSKAAKDFMAKIRAKRKTKTKKSLGAAGDYLKYEKSVIKLLAKALKKTIAFTTKLVNENDNLLKVISANFDKKIAATSTAKELKEILQPKKAAVKKNAFIELVDKLAKGKKAAAKKQPDQKIKFPLKIPAQVQIGSVNKNAIDEIKYRLERINKMQNDIEFLTGLIKTANPIAKKSIKADINFAKNIIKDFKLQIQKLKKHIK